MQIKAEKLIKHPSYGNPYNLFKFDWDIALVKLKVPIIFSGIRKNLDFFFRKKLFVLDSFTFFLKHFNRLC